MPDRHDDERNGEREDPEEREEVGEVERDAAVVVVADRIGFGTFPP